MDDQRATSMLLPEWWEAQRIEVRILPDGLADFVVLQWFDHYDRATDSILPEKRRDQLLNVASSTAVGNSAAIMR